MKRFAASAAFLVPVPGLAACSAPAPEIPERSEPPREPLSTEVQPPVAIKSLEWKSDHVVLTLEPEWYDVGTDNLPEGLSLPA